MLTSFFRLNLLSEKKQNFVEETSEAPERQSKSDSPALLKPAWYRKRDPLGSLKLIIFLLPKSSLSEELDRDDSHSQMDGFV